MKKMRFKKFALIIFFLLILLSYYNIRLIQYGYWFIPVSDYIIITLSILIGYLMRNNVSPTSTTCLRLVIAWLPGLLIWDVHEWINEYED